MRDQIEVLQLRKHFIYEDKTIFKTSNYNVSECRLRMQEAR